MSQNSLQSDLRDQRTISHIELFHSVDGSKIGTSNTATGQSLQLITRSP